MGREETTPLLSSNDNYRTRAQFVSTKAHSWRKTILTFPWRILLVTLVLSSAGSLNFGISIAILNPIEVVMHPYINESYTQHYGRPMSEGAWLFWWPLLLCIPLIGSSIGAFPIVPLTERLGRRKTLYVGAAVAVVGLITQAMSRACNSFELLISGRFVMSLSSGLCPLVEGMYYNEISPVHLRGVFSSITMTFFELGFVLGIALGLPLMLGTSERWPWIFVVQLTPILIAAFFCLPFIPESPRYLFSRGRMDEARRALRFYKHKDIDASINEIELEIRCQVEQVKLKELWQRPFLRRGILQSMLVQCVTALSGITAIEFSSIAILSNVGMSTTAARYATLGIHLCGLCGSISGTLLIDRLGRRSLLLASAACLIATNTISMIAYQIYVSYGYEWAGYVNVFTFGVTACCFCFGPATLHWVVPVEIVPQNARSASQLVTSIVAETTMFMVGFSFYPLHKVAGAFSFFLFIVPLVVLLVIAWKTYIETKNLTIAEIMRRFGYQEEKEAL